MSDTNRVGLKIIEETVPGTTPATPAWETLRMTGAPSLAFTPITVTSNEIREDRNVQDLILVGAEAGGDTNHELSYGALDTILRGLMFNPWTERNNRKGSDVTDITSQVITVVSGTAFAVDDLIYLEGFGDANDEIVFPAIATSNATTITAASGLTDNATPGAGACVRNVGVQGATGDIDSATGPNRFTSTILDFTTLGLLVGDWIKAGGALAANQFPTAANNGWYKISAISANSLEFSVVPTGFTADASTTENIWLFFSDRIRNGTQKFFYSIEESFNDHTPVSYQYFTGMRPNIFNLNISSQSIITTSNTWIGFNANPTTTRFAGSTDIAAPQNTVFNTSSNIGRIGRGSDGPIVGPNYILDSTFVFNNNMRRQNAVGNLGSIGIGDGEFGVTGTINTYFGNLDIYNDVIGNTPRAFDIRVKDALDKVMIFDAPRMKLSGGNPTVPGKNQDVLMEVGFQAVLDTVTQLYTLQIQRFHKTQ